VIDPQPFVVGLMCELPDKGLAQLSEAE